MDIKLVALVLVFLAVTVEITETMPFPGAFLLQSQNIMARKYARHHSEKQQKAKRSVEDADMSLDEYRASGLADKPQIRHKRAVFSGNIIVVGVMCGVAAVIALGAVVWTVYMFFYKRDQIGGGTTD